ncbi:hypothetical protein GT348_03875 [Aristophania vespae]|uniref:Uncharacterized protein n=1 Tax=Aristophania vespae TaxID=2697033 RepID=A0A6P1NG68_9PROT|nr:hypothetical protein [Aristophania vespae]QHI95520.1 hypothetical protein GT348_03875 [Aristophania vespae]
MTQSFYAFLTIADIFINKDLSGKKSLYKSKICAINVLKNRLKSSYAYIEKVKTYFSGNNIYTFLSAWAKNIFQSVIITPKTLCKIMFFQRWKKATLIATITNITWSKIYSINPVHIGKLLFIEGFNHA